MKVVIEIPEAQHREFKTLASRQGATMSDLVREFIDALCKGEYVPAPPVEIERFPGQHKFREAIRKMGNPKKR
jgi:hypothetical protein